MSNILLSTLWRASWQGGLLIAALWCLGRIFEKRLPADTRCWLWRLSYIKLLAGLVITGSINLPILPAAQTSGLPQTTLIRTLADNTAMASSSTNTKARTKGAVGAALGPVSVPTWPWQEALVTLYLVGFVVCLCRIVRAGVRTRHLLRHSILSGDTAAGMELAELACGLGLRHRPRLMTSAEIESPVYAAGVVLLPMSAGYTPENHRLILAHELAHARRRDLAWEWLGTLTQTLFFFHPLVLIARREERLARESAADALALRITAAPASAYGKLLLTISLSRPGKSLAGAVGVIERGTLLRRRLLNLKENHSMTVSQKRTARYMILVTIAAAVIIVPWQVQAARSLETSQSPLSSLLVFAPLPAKPKLITPADKADAAIRSGDTKAATRYALQMLANNTDSKDWNYGNIIHGANQILGLAALQEGRIEDAKKYLIAAGSTPGSPQLNSFGPNMILAQQLLDKGEKDVVTQYLDLTAKFWARFPDSAELARIEKRHPGFTATQDRLNRIHQTQIDDWKQQIQAGQKPVLNMSGILLKIGPSNSAPLLAPNHRKVSVQADRVTKMKSGTLIEGHVVVTTYESGKIVSVGRADKAFIKAKHPGSDPANPSASEIEVNPKRI